MDKTEVMHSIYGVARKNESVTLEDFNPLVITIPFDSDTINSISEILVEEVGRETSNNLQIDTDIRDEKVFVTFPNLMEKNYDGDRYELH